MLIRQIRFARLAAAFIHDHLALELLPEQLAREDGMGTDIFIVVLFRAKSPKLNAELVNRINASARMYVSQTVWRVSLSEALFPFYSLVGYYNICYNNGLHGTHAVKFSFHSGLGMLTSDPEQGEPASRIAVSNWQVDPERDMKIVREVIEDVISK